MKLSLNYYQKLNRFEKEEVESLLLVFSCEKFPFDQRAPFVTKVKKETSGMLKRELILFYLEKFLENKLTLEQEAHLDILYYLKHPTKLSWSLYLGKKTVQNDFEKGIVSGSQLRKKLENELNQYFPTKTYSVQFEKQVWVWFRTEFQLNQFCTSYLLLQPNLPLLLIANLNLKITPYVLQSCKTVFKFSNLLEKANVLFRHPQDILKVQLVPTTLGVGNLYQSQPSFNPNLHLIPPIYPNVIQLEAGLPKLPVIATQPIHNLDLKLQAERTLETWNLFGTAKLPKLDQLQFKVKLNLFQQEMEMEMENEMENEGEEMEVEVEVCLKGDDVLEGIKFLNKTYSLHPSLTDLKLLVNSNFTI